MPAITAPSTCDHSRPGTCPRCGTRAARRRWPAPQQTLAPRPRRRPGSMGAWRDTGRRLLEDCRVDLGRPLVIVNPRSGAGLSEARWARVRGALTDGLGELDSAFTTGPRDATAIAEREAAAGRRLIVALRRRRDDLRGRRRRAAGGRRGDATEIALIPRGTGGDFRRTLELPHEIGAAARHIRETRAQAGRRRARPLPRARRQRGGPPLRQRRLVRVLQRRRQPRQRVVQALRRPHRLLGRDAARR